MQMVTVATKLDGPIKLLFPRGVTDAVTCKPQFALLGLGDLVIPGLMIALLLRLDATNAHAALPNQPQGAGLKRRSPHERFNSEHAASFPAHYFNGGILGYAAGLVLTVMVMVWFEAAQPVSRIDSGARVWVVWQKTFASALCVLQILLF
jgi:minor histocompatibility antigen H13